MNILIYSDLHLYENNLPFELPNPTTYDVVVIAGDVSNGRFDILLWLHDLFVKQLNKEFIFVPGNHDFYHTSIEELYAFLDKNNIKTLRTGVCYSLQGFTFVGDTYWSNFELQRTKELSMNFAGALIQDYKCIALNGSLLTPQDTLKFNYEANSWFDSFRHKKNIILVTHFPMSKICLDPFYQSAKYSHLNPYFINDVNTSGFHLIISGHTHTCVDLVDVYNCRHIINALGYQSEFENNSNGFNRNKIIKV